MRISAIVKEMSIFRKYTEDELLAEFYKLSNSPIELKRKNIGYKCSNAFFQHERMNTPSRKAEYD